jgi:hypothetical protein
MIARTAELPVTMTSTLRADELGRVLSVRYALRPSDTREAALDRVLRQAAVDRDVDRPEERHRVGGTALIAQLLFLR